MPDELPVGAAGAALRPGGPAAARRGQGSPPPGEHHDDALDRRDRLVPWRPPPPNWRRHPRCLIFLN